MPISIWLKKINHKNICSKLVILGAVFLLSVSCTDQGCVDADDFGEYESQTLTISANSLESYCTYDRSLSDFDQGQGIKTCLSQGTPSVTDENNVTTTASTGGIGCKGFADEKLKNLCIDNCVQACLTSSTGNSASAEPYWLSTDKKIAGTNTGVTIRPGSQIVIRAIGTVILGDNVQYPAMHVSPTKDLPHTANTSWQDSLYFDARSNQSLGIKFSGQYVDNADGANDPTSTIGGGSTALGGGADTAIYNAGKRMIAYLVPHPTGYQFDSSQTTEKLASKKVPLLPDAATWQCSFTSGAGMANQATCTNIPTGYVDAGYTSVDDAAASATFPVTSGARSTILTQYGGFIRWDGDNLVADNLTPLNNNDMTPFATVSCTTSTGACVNLDTVPSDKGRIVGDLSASSGVTIANPDNSSSYKISFRSLVPSVSGTGCSSTIAVNVKNLNSDILYSYSLNITSANWSTTNISLEPNQTLFIAQNTDSYNSNSINCGKFLALKFGKYQDLQMQQSGFVKFTMLRGTGSCAIAGRVINPSGNHLQFTSSGITKNADFYEYGDFNTTNLDPLDSLTVPASPPLVQTLNWSNRVFVRKGQVIRFAPESWNGTWSAGMSGLIRNCGIGMAMIIEPRPALLCRGKATDYVNNPLCVPDINSNGNLIGCRAVDIACSTSTSASFCPQSCQQAITGCTPGTADSYMKTGCQLSSTKPAGCTYPSDGSKPTANSCNSCGGLMLAAAGLPAKNSVSSIDQCYDLENYTGKVSNLPIPTAVNGAVSLSEVNTFLNNSAVAKGASKLGGFNGSYGNLQNFESSGESDSGNIVYRLKTPVVFSKAGRLKFLLLDGNDFSSAGAISSYTNNSALGSGWSGSNGFKLALTSTLEFNNGEWLQARLCKAESDNGAECRASNPTAFAGPPTQPFLVEIATPTSATPVGAPPSLTGRYQFDGFGNIFRFAPLTTADCTNSSSGTTPDGAQTEIGSLFYCHTYNYVKPSALKSSSTNPLASSVTDPEIAKLRVTFKILDPEIGNCNLSGTNDGVILPNPFYDGTSSGTCAGGSVNEIAGDGSSGSPGSCRKQYFCGNKYSNNSGQYYVNVKVKSPLNGTISSIIGSVVTPVIEVMDGPKDGSQMGEAERIYKLIVADPRYKLILNMCIVMMFTFYGVGYLMGVSELKHSDIFDRIIKIGLIYFFVSEEGWYWFDKIVVKFFKNGTDQLAFMMAYSFDNSADIKNSIANSDYYDKSVLFGSVDRVFSMFFSSAVQKKVAALLFSGLFGWAYLLLIYSGFMLYVYAVANAVLLYLTAQVFISILFTLGPIFMVFTLFGDKTKNLFDAWLSQLIGFSLQQIFLLVTLAFFNLLMYEVIKMSLGFKICWDEVWTINIITRITLMSFWTIAALPPRTNVQGNAGNIGSPDAIPSLFSILFIWVIASMMKKFIGYMTDLAATMGGGVSASTMGGSIAKFADDMQKKASKTMGELWEKSGGKAIERLDEKFFDSGKEAERKREIRKKENAENQKNKSVLSKAGDKAVSDYKKNNANEFAKIPTKEEQRAKLDKVRKEGIKNAGEKLGLNPEQIKSLQSSTGLKYEGSNVFGAAFQAIRQAHSKGGTLATSVEDQKLSTKFSQDEAKEALQKMKPDERKDFIAAATQGKVDVSKDTTLAKKAQRIAAGAASFGSTEFVRAVRKDVIKDSRSYSDATKQLEKEGLITKMLPGNNALAGYIEKKFLRSDTEKKLIRKRQRENTDKVKDGKVKMADPKAIAKMERESEYLGEKEQIEINPKAGIGERLKNFGKKVAAYGRKIDPGVLNRKDNAYVAKAAEAVKESFTQRIDAALESSQTNMAELDDSRNVISAELKTINNKLSVNKKAQAEEQKEIAKKKSRTPIRRVLKENRVSQKESVAAKAKMKKLESELSEDPNQTAIIEEYTQLTQRKKELNIAALGNDDQRINIGRIAANAISSGANTKSTQKTERSTAHQYLAKTMPLIAIAPATRATKKALKQAGKIVDRARRTIKENDVEKPTLLQAQEKGKAEEIVRDYEDAKTPDDFKNFSQRNRLTRKLDKDIKTEVSQERRKVDEKDIGSLKDFVRNNSDKKEFGATRPQISVPAPAPVASGSAAAAPAPSASAPPIVPPSSSAAP